MALTEPSPLITPGFILTNMIIFVKQIKMNIKACKE